MRWEIASYKFCEHQQQLISSTNETTMEPMLVELLAYFCRHPGVTISRDELITEVWSGRIVTDSAVNRAITKLRKLFNDDPKKPQFIATFPKKGYRFIAEVKELTSAENDLESKPEWQKRVELKISDDQKKQLNHNKNSRFFSKTLVLFSCLFVLSAVLITILITENHSEQYSFSRLKPLTQDAGFEVLPSFSPNLKYFSYSNIKNNRMTSTIREVGSQIEIKVTHEDYPDSWIGPVAWSKDSKLIAYTVTTKQQCMHFIRSFSNMKLSAPRLIHNCNKGSAGRIQFLHQNNRLVFAESEVGGSKYQLYEINLDTNKITRLNQPEVVLAGNNQFDVHPTENKLLISSPDKQQWENFYSLDIESGELTKLFGLDAYICCAIWSHSGDEVVLMGEHPSKELMAFDLKGNNKRVMFANGEVIYRPQRHGNGKDYLVNRDTLNQDIHALDLLSKQQQILVDATSDDRLGKLSPTLEQLAFISLVSEQEQVWLLDIETGSKRQISNFTDNFRFLDLLWSPNGKTLAALTLNEIYIVDAATAKTTKLAMAQSEIKGLSFPSNNILSFSRRLDGVWKVQEFNLDSNELIIGDSEWQYIDHNAGTTAPLKINQKGKVYIGHNRMDELEPWLKSIIPNRNFDFKYFQGSWYFTEYEGGQGVLYKLTAGKKQKIASDVTHFAIQGSQLIYTKRLQQGSDIYSTTSN